MQFMQGDVLQLHHIEIKILDFLNIDEDISLDFDKSIGTLLFVN